MSKIRQGAFLALVLAGLLFGKTGRQTDETAPAQQKAPAERQSPGPVTQRQGFLDFALKMVNPNEKDFGELIAERRAALADASVTNPYFWYSAGATATVIALLFLLHVKIMQYKNLEWQIAVAITDLQNAEKMATAKGRETVARYNQHMLQCNRVIEAETSGRSLPGAIANQDLQRTAEDLHRQVEVSEAEKTRLSQQLERKEELIRDLNRRLDRLEQTEAGRGSASSGQQTQAELLALVDRLTRQLDAEQRKNGALKGA